MSEPDFQRFIDGETSDWAVTFPDGRNVEIREELVTCSAEWGGWSWRAQGGSRASAAMRVQQRLLHMNPFHGFDTDWGPPGHLLGKLDESIPAPRRERMSQYDEERESELERETLRSKFGRG